MTIVTEITKTDIVKAIKARKKEKSPSLTCPVFQSAVRVGIPIARCDYGYLMTKNNQRFLINDEAQEVTRISTNFESRWKQTIGTEVIFTGPDIKLNPPKKKKQAKRKSSKAVYLQAVESFLAVAALYPGHNPIHVAAGVRDIKLPLTQTIKILTGLAKQFKDQNPIHVAAGYNDMLKKVKEQN